MVHRQHVPMDKINSNVLSSPSGRALNHPAAQSSARNLRNSFKSSGMVISCCSTPIWNVFSHLYTEGSWREAKESDASRPAYCRRTCPPGCRGNHLVQSYTLPSMTSHRSPLQLCFFTSSMEYSVHVKVIVFCGVSDSCNGCILTFGGVRRLVWSHALSRRRYSFNFVPDVRSPARYFRTCVSCTLDAFDFPGRRHCHGSVRNTAAASQFDRRTRSFRLFGVPGDSRLDRARIRKVEQQRS